LKPSQRPWFRALALSSAGILYVLACWCSSWRTIYDPSPEPFTWWHPVALVVWALLAASVVVVERMVMPSADRASNSVSLTDDEWDLIKRCREDRP